MNTALTIVCLCGWPCAGKTTAANALRVAFGWLILTAKAIGEAALDADPTLLEEDSSGRKPSMSVIGSADDEDDVDEDAYGDDPDELNPSWARVDLERPEAFVQALEALIENQPGTIIVDGIRGRETILSMRDGVNALVRVICVQASPETREHFFLGRGRMNGTPYAAISERAIEVDQPRLPLLADACVWNDGAEDGFLEALFGAIDPDARIHPNPSRCVFCGSQLATEDEDVGEAQPPTAAHVQDEPAAVADHPDQPAPHVPLCAACAVIAREMESVASPDAKRHEHQDQPDDRADNEHGSDANTDKEDEESEVDPEDGDGDAADEDALVASPSDDVCTDPDCKDRTSRIFARTTEGKKCSRCYQRWYRKKRAREGRPIGQHSRHRD